MAVGRQGAVTLVWPHNPYSTCCNGSRHADNTNKYVRMFPTKGMSISTLSSVVHVATQTFRHPLLNALQQKLSAPQGLGKKHTHSPTLAKEGERADNAGGLLRPVGCQSWCWRRPRWPSAVGRRCTLLQRQKTRRLGRGEGQTRGLVSAVVASPLLPRLHSRVACAAIPSTFAISARSPTSLVLQQPAWAKPQVESIFVWLL